MRIKWNRIVAVTAFVSISLFAHAEPSDRRLVGQWAGQRDADTKCTFLSWQMNLMEDGTFRLTFFSDKDQTKKIQTENGVWKAQNGISELTTRGVPNPDVYAYTFLDENRVRYVNTKRDPSGDCQADYEFTEHRVTK